MLMLSKPSTQDRLNAAVVEVIGLNVMGPVSIPGSWNAEKAILYIEKRLKEPITHQVNDEEGTQFYAQDKVIHFSSIGVQIEPLQTTMP